MTPEYRELRIEHAERYLREVRDLAVKHRANDAYIKSLEDDAQGVGGVDYSRVMVQTTPTADAMPNSVALLIDMKREAEADAAEYFERKREARRLLNAMDGTHGRLLMLRYVTVLPWVSVADVLNYSEDWCRHMLPDALCEFYDYLPHAYRLPEQQAM
jgi:hypothetical protein